MKIDWGRLIVQVVVGIVISFCGKSTHGNFSIDWRLVGYAVMLAAPIREYCVARRILLQSAEHKPNNHGDG